MTEEGEERFRKNDNYRFCEKNFEQDEVIDHYHLTGKYGGPAHRKSNIDVTLKQSIFIPFLFHNFSNYDCHMFFKKLIDKKMTK